MAQQGVASRLARGVRLAGAWQVECVLRDDEAPSALLARSDEGRRAVCFLLGDDPRPSEDSISASVWGTSRSILEDEEHGTIVVDAVALEARPLAAIEADDAAAALAIRNRIAETARAERERGAEHGRIRRELVFASRDGTIHVPGWGLAGPNATPRNRDLADAALLGGGELPGGTLAAPPGAPSLAAAIRSEDRGTLRRAIEAARSGRAGAAPDELARAEDALRRIEARIDACLVRAERQLAVRDPLGAVAACREAVRFGAGSRAERLLKRARRQAKELLAPPKPRRRLLPLAAAGLLLVAALVATLVIVPGNDDATELRSAVEGLAEERGERAAMLHLLSAAERTPGRVAPEQLVERLSRLVSDERETLLRLRREAIADGMRPRQADEVADEAFAGLDGLDDSLEHPAFSTRLARVLARVDRAAALYRARTSLSADDAARAVEQLIAIDPVFGRAADGEGP